MTASAQRILLATGIVAAVSGCSSGAPDIVVEPTVLNRSQLAVSGVVYVEVAPNEYMVKVLRPEVDRRLIHSIAEQGGVVVLYLERTTGVDMEELSRLHGIRELHMARSDVSEIKELGAFKQLERLDLRNTRIRSLRPLKGLDKLAWLDVSETGIDDLWPLFKNDALEVLKARDTKIKDVEPLVNSSGLVELDISETSVRDIGELAKLPKLRKLAISMTPVKDISPVAQMAALEELDLFGADQISDFGALARAKNLKLLNLQETGVTEEQVRKLRAALPNAHIVVSEEDKDRKPYETGWP